MDVVTSLWNVFTEPPAALVDGYWPILSLILPFSVAESEIRSKNLIAILLSNACEIYVYSVFIWIFVADPAENISLVFSFYLIFWWCRLLFVRPVLGGVAVSLLLMFLVGVVRVYFIIPQDQNTVRFDWGELNLGFTSSTLINVITVILIFFASLLFGVWHVIKLGVRLTMNTFKANLLGCLIVLPVALAGFVLLQDSIASQIIWLLFNLMAYPILLSILLRPDTLRRGDVFMMYKEGLKSIPLLGQLLKGWRGEN
ncbi:hypothetical protein E0H39_07120 [Rhizobium leguminosarum bv. viciae]|uniref:hypothetical protein n=1 Tax=Rhizobium leguminosarum TaxID=384 RepID=UPI00103BA414|nr:hypothetical protein [Rhizobium leguminosarum]TBY65762.1 hypothetical protein E0H39_07120 [Rhizobium leguminosarum bv. viciae]